MDNVLFITFLGSGVNPFIIPPMSRCANMMSQSVLVAKGEFPQRKEKMEGRGWKCRFYSQTFKYLVFLKFQKVLL